MKISETNRLGPSVRAEPITRVSDVGQAARADSSATPAPRGTTDDVATVFGIPEVELTANVRRGINLLLEEVDRLRQQIEQRDRRVAYLEKLADEDPLTPVLNRRAFVRELSRMMAFAERYGTPSSVLFFDVDGMKQINDTRGHGAGDATLSHVAMTLVNSIRSSDVVGRLGGDEFGVLLAQIDEETAANKAIELADRVRATPLLIEGEAMEITLSYGVFAFNGREEPQAILDAADRQMYKFKRAQRDPDQDP